MYLVVGGGLHGYLSPPLGLRQSVLDVPVFVSLDALRPFLRDKAAPKKLKANTPLRTVALIAYIASTYCSSGRSASPSVTEQA